MFRVIRTLVAAAIMAAACASCAPRMDISVDASAPGLRDAMVRLANDYSRTTGRRITLRDAGKASTAKAAMIVIDWGYLPSKEAPSSAVIEARDPDGHPIATAYALSAWADQGGQWSEAPLLWDCWGLAVFPSGTEKTSPRGIFAWRDRKTFLPPTVFVAAGGEAGTRQALFWLSDHPLPVGADRVKLMSGAADPLSAPWRDVFAGFPALAADPQLGRDAFHYADADLGNLAALPGTKAILGPYSRLRTLPASTTRAFTPLVYPLEQGYALPVAVLTARISGRTDPGGRAGNFIRWLLKPENQRALSEATGLMAVNFGAPLLDPQALSARDAATGAAEILPIDPEPRGSRLSVAWDLLVSHLAEAPAQWEESVRKDALGTHE